MLFDGVKDAFHHETEEGENNGELRDDDAEIEKSVDNEPRMREKGDFREEDAENEGRIAGVATVVVLCKDVAGGTIADNKFE